MATSFLIDDVIEVRYEGVTTAFTNRWNNVHHLRLVTLGSSTGINDFDVLVSLAEAMFTLYQEQLLFYMSETTVMLSCRTKRIAPTDSVFGLYSNTVSGTVSSPVDEPDDAVVITKRTAAPGRRGLGRNYLPGPPDADVMDGILTVGRAGELALGAKRVFGSGVSALGYDFVPVVWSATAYAAVPLLLAAAPEVLIVELDRHIRRQTRREHPGRLVTVGEEP